MPPSAPGHRFRSGSGLARPNAGAELCSRILRLGCWRPPRSAPPHLLDPSGPSAAAGHADHGLVEMDSASRSVKRGVAKGEHPAIRRHQPIPTTIRSRRNPNNRPIQHHPTRRTIKRGVTKGEHPTIRRHQRVAGGGCRGRRRCRGCRRRVSDCEHGACELADGRRCCRVQLEGHAGRRPGAVVLACDRLPGARTVIGARIPPFDRLATTELAVVYRQRGKGISC